MKKNQLLTIAIFAMLLAMSCEQEAEPTNETINPFVGTWETDGFCDPNFLTINNK